jgi:hypothetical protein
VETAVDLAGLATNAVEGESLIDFRIIAKLIPFANSLGCAPTSGTCCANGYCSAGKSCCVRNGRYFCADRCSTSNDNDDDEEEQEENIPTIIFPNLDMREVCRNTWIWILGLSVSSVRFSKICAEAL